MTPTGQICVKRGDTFSFAGAGTLPPGTWSCASQARGRTFPYPTAPGPGSDVLLCEFDVTLTLNGAADSNGNFPYLLAIEKSATATAEWPIGDYSIDVQFVDSSGVTISSQTIPMRVELDITHG